MPAVLRLATLTDRQFRIEPEEYFCLVQHLQRLDELSRTLGVTVPSAFIDVTELEFLEAAKLIEPESLQAPEVDPLTGLAYGIEDMIWTPVSAGMISFEALSGYLSRNQPAGVNEHDRHRLRRELAGIEERLRPLEAQGAQFHLAAR